MSKEYPEIQADHQIVDIATARIAARPGSYDVIVTSNLYGDIISDVVAEVAGSVGLAGSANIGASSALFEAIHGSAPDIAGIVCVVHGRVRVLACAWAFPRGHIAAVPACIAVPSYVVVSISFARPIFEKSKEGCLICIYRS